MGNRNRNLGCGVVVMETKYYAHRFKSMSKGLLIQLQGGAQLGSIASGENMNEGVLIGTQTCRTRSV